MPKVILKGYILVPNEQLDMVQEALVEHVRLTLEEPGCIVFSVEQNAQNPLRFDVYEEFVDKVAFENHQQRVVNSYWGRVTKDVERHYSIQ